MTCHDDYTDSTVASARPLYVVGIDDSKASATTLRWAVATAAATDGEVYAVHVFHSRTVRPPVRSPYVPAEVPTETFEQQADLATTREIVQRALGHDVPTRASGRIEIAAVAGDPRHTLIDLSRGADALVLGASHLVGLVARVLGSTAAACAANAACPVMIVPEGWRPEDANALAQREEAALLGA